MEKTISELFRVDEYNHVYDENNHFYASWFALTAEEKAIVKRNPFSFY